MTATHYEFPDPPDDEASRRVRKIMDDHCRAMARNEALRLEADIKILLRCGYAREEITIVHFAAHGAVMRPSQVWPKSMLKE